MLRGLSAANEKLLRGVPGIVDLSNQEQASVPQLLVDFDRQAMARHGLSPADLARSVEALFQGASAGEVVEGGLTSRVVVGFPERLRAHRDDLEALPVTTPGGAVVRLGEVARARFDLGPGLVPRENVQRLAMITANVALPLAMVGGMLAVAVGGAGLSVASLVGIITLFGIATRNGVLLVTHYEHVMREEGLPLCEAVACGSRERLAPLLMTALTAGLALIPLVLAGEKPGNEIQSPMAEVILGGLLSSTFLNLVVVPVLFARWGKDPTHEQLEPGAKA